MLSSWATRLTRSGRSDSRRSPPPGPRSSRPRRPAATHRHSGCIRRAAPVARRAACTCSTTWSCAPSSTRAASSASRERDRCFSVAKLFFAYGLGNAHVLSVRRRRHQHPLARARHAAPSSTTIIERHRPTLFFSVPTHYAMLLAHRAGSARLRSVQHPAAPCRPAKRCRRRCSTGFGQRFGVEILDGIGSTETLHIFISNRPGACVRARAASLGARLRGAPRRRERARRCRRARSAICLISGDSTCALLLESARADQGHDRRPLDPDRRQVPRRTRTASSGSPGAPTTC